MSGFSVVVGEPCELNLLVDHRLSMWKEIFPEIAAEVEFSGEATRIWISAKLRQGTLISFVARSSEGTVAGSGCLLIKEDQPRPTSRTVYNPYLMSMFTEKGFRKQGVATMITREAIAWCRKHGYDRMTLHASSAGRHVYEKLGFEQTNEMRLLL